MLIQNQVTVFQSLLVGTLNDFATLRRHNTTKSLPTPVLNASSTTTIKRFNKTPHKWKHIPHIYAYTYHTHTHIFHGSTAVHGPGLHHCQGIMIILGHTKVGRTPLDKESAHCSDLYLTTHNTQKKGTSTNQWDSTLQSQQGSGCRPTP
jgi:hypothetical protein